MKQLAVIFSLGLFVFGCKPQLKPEKPENLIPKDEMTLVLYDLFVVNSAKGIDRVLFENKGINPEVYILEKYNIDSTQFAKSNDYYAHDIEVYNDIIEKVKERITLEAEKFEVISKEEQNKERKRDSLKRKDLKMSLEKKLIDGIEKQD
jgi:hypothetical protein